MDEAFPAICPKFGANKPLELLGGDPGSGESLIWAKLAELDHRKIVHGLQVRVVRELQETLEVESGLEACLRSNLQLI